MRWGAVSFLLVMLSGRAALAVDLAEGQKLFKTGEYAQAIDAAAKGIEDDPWREGWWALKVRAELATGKYATILDGPWMYPIFEAAHPDFDLQVAPVPAGDGGSVSVVGGEDVVVFRG
jgi:ABC-type glycerol-3-phosphate transport system substrate-binding protein